MAHADSQRLEEVAREAARVAVDEIMNQPIVDVVGQHDGRHTVDDYILSCSKCDKFVGRITTKLATIGPVIVLCPDCHEKARS